LLRTTARSDDGTPSKPRVPDEFSGRVLSLQLRLQRFRHTLARSCTTTCVTELPGDDDIGGSMHQRPAVILHKVCHNGRRDG
jgi:hypothetical protein